MHSIINFLLGTTHWQSQWSCSPYRELVDTRHYNNNIIITIKHVINGSLQTEGLILFFYIFSVTHPVDKCFIRDHRTFYTFYKPYKFYKSYTFYKSYKSYKFYKLWSSFFVLLSGSIILNFVSRKKLSGESHLVNNRQIYQ